MISYTLQAWSEKGHWYDVNIDPHHETLEAARERRFQGQMRNPNSKYRILRVIKEVWEE